MSTDDAAPTTKPLVTPYQLDLTQTTQACKVLLRHITDEKKRREAEKTTSNLLADDDDAEEEAADVDDTPVWMIVTTKKHIVDQKRLKPSKIALPNSINTSPTATICLITADPSSAFTAALDSPAFPSELRTRITRVISVSKIKSSYHDYEARRRLLAEHDLFLADDRIITYLPKVLGKVFYKGGSKRPVPVSVAPPSRRGEDGKRVKVDPEAAQRKRDGKDKAETSKGAAAPQVVAKEIERALGSALVHLAPGVSTAVKVGVAGMTSEAISANIEAVMKGLTEKVVTQGWRNIRSVHIKGPNSVAFPIWLASELWTEDADVKEEKPVFGKKKNATKAIEGSNPAGAETGGVSRKRKADGVVDKSTKTLDPDRHAKKKRKAEASEKLAQEVALRKERLKKQKEEALAEVV